MKIIQLRLSILLLILLYSMPALSVERLAPPLTAQINISASTSGAHTLYSLHRNTLDKQGNWTRTRYVSVKINDLESARDYGRIRINYNDYYFETKLNFANILTKDGVIKPVAADAIRVIKTGSGQDFYEDRAEIAFSLPQVEPGSILEFQFTKTTKVRAIETIHSDAVSPYWFQKLVAGDGWRADPVANFSYQRSIPAKLKMVTKVYGNQPNLPIHTQDKHQQVSSWNWKNIPKYEIEAYMPPAYKLLPSISSSSDTSWSKIDAWTWQKIAPKLHETQTIREIVASLNISADATDMEKIRAVYGYMQSNIRYVFAHLARGGYEPHSPDQVIHSKYGDCKDQTVLTITLLKSLGVKAYPLLVETPSAGFSDTALVRLIFDHMMVWIPANESHEEVWLDNTGDHTLFPGAAAEIQGQTALIVDGQGGKLIHVDMAENKNFAQLDMVYRFGKKRNIVVSADITFKGIYEQKMRSWWKHDNKRETNLEKLVDSIFGNSGQYELTADVQNSENIHEPFRIAAKFIFKPAENDQIPINLGVSAMQLIRVFGSFSSMQIPDTRRNRYVTNLSSHTRLTVKFETPEIYNAAVIRSAENYEAPYLKLKQQIYKIDDSYHVEINLHQPRVDLSVAEYRTFYEDVLTISEHGAWVVNFQKNTAKTTQAHIRTLEDSGGKETLGYQVALAKRYIDTGEFEKALAPALRAVKIDTKNGEAWFVLGMARGFSGQIEKSQQAFDQAKSLGFVP